jgi:hypothetical protein
MAHDQPVASPSTLACNKFLLKEEPIKSFLELSLSQNRMAFRPERRKKAIKNQGKTNKKNTSSTSD